MERLITYIYIYICIMRLFCPSNKTTPPAPGRGDARRILPGKKGIYFFPGTPKRKKKGTSAHIKTHTARSHTHPHIHTPMYRHIHTQTERHTHTHSRTHTHRHTKSVDVWARVCECAYVYFWQVLVVRVRRCLCVGTCIVHVHTIICESVFVLWRE